MNVDRQRFLDGVHTMAESVYAFHERFDIPCVDPTDTDDALEALRQRLVLLSEEIGEYARALNQARLGDATLEAADVAYVALGTVLRLGDEGRKACVTVTRKNDSKTPSTHGTRRSTGKVLESM